MTLEHGILCNRVTCVILETIQTKCQDNESLLQLKTFRLLENYCSGSGKYSADILGTASLQMQATYRHV